MASKKEFLVRVLNQKWNIGQSITRPEFWSLETLTPNTEAWVFDFSLSKLKKVGTQSRTDLEKFFGNKIFLETHVRVADNWRNNESMLRKFGYKD